MFGSKKKAPDAREVTKKWGRQLRGEMRRLDREMRTMEREQAKIKNEIKKEAKRSGGKSKAVGIMARSLVQSNKHKSRLLESKTQINSTVLALKQAEATAKVAGHMQSSAAVMKSINSLMSVSSVAKTAREMQRELAHAGVVDEMVEDAFAMIEPDGLEEAADEEVDSILAEILQGQLGKAGEIKGRALAGVEDEPVEVDEVNADEEKELEEMRARLARLDAA